MLQLVVVGGITCVKVSHKSSGSHCDNLNDLLVFSEFAVSKCFLHFPLGMLVFELQNYADLRNDYAMYSGLLRLEFMQTHLERQGMHI